MASSRAGMRRIVLAIAASMAHGHRTAHGWAPSAKGGGAAVRSRRESVTFRRPFRICCVGCAHRMIATRRLRWIAPTWVVTDEETIKGLSFPAWRRVPP